MQNVFIDYTLSDLTVAILRIKEIRTDYEKYSNYQDYLDKNAAVERSPK